MNRPIRYFSQCTSMIVALLLISGLSSNRRDALAAAPTTHEIDFSNNCAQPIWIASLGPDVTPTNGWELAPRCDAAVPKTCPGPGSICVNSQCSCTAAAASDPTNCAGAACIPNPTMAGKFVCATANSMLVPPQTYRIWGRTGCTGSGAKLTCKTGDCAGQLDCFNQGGSPPVSLFELTVAAVNGIDNYDVSLVDGYSLPLTVRAVIPTDTPGWTPNTTYHNGAGGSGFSQSVIAASAGSYTWRFNEVGSADSAKSGTIVPKFSPLLGGQVMDPPSSTDIIWSTTTPTCQTGLCKYDGTASDSFLTACPTPLMVTAPGLSCTTASDCPRQAPCSGGHCVIACDAPVDYCGKNSSEPLCNSQNNSFFQCVNLLATAEKDIRDKAINLQSPGAGSQFCLNPTDCKAGTKCIFNPTFTPKSNVPTFPKNLGVCAPGNGFSPADGGCPRNGTMDGLTCPGPPGAIFPFPSYTCATLTNAGGGNIQMCLPPVDTTSTLGDFGYVVWNADNFTPTNTGCTSDTGCSSNQFCLEKTVRKHRTGGVLDAQAVNECLGANDPAGCVCNNIKTCTNNNDCHQSQCHDLADHEYLPGTTCPSATNKGPCICQTNAVYTGICGPMNQNWVDAYNKIQNNSGDNYISVSKNNCSTAYSFQFDDQSGDFTCYDTSDQLVNYKITFCGAGGKQ